MPIKKAAVKKLSRKPGRKARAKKSRPRAAAAAKKPRRPVARTVARTTGPATKPAAKSASAPATAQARPAASAPQKSAAPSGRKRLHRNPAMKRTAAERLSSARKARRLVTQAKLLGRPRLPADAKLDFIFRKDYQAREVFTFLNVQTLRELEEFSPNEIVEKLTGPMVQTVQRIRKILALYNRCLADDGSFALKFKAQLRQRT